MSIQTTLAAAAARQAAADMRAHIRECVQCATAQHRRGLRRCHEGGMLHAALQAADNQLAAERAADRRPAPGQGELPLDLPGQLELWGDVTP